MPQSRALRCARGGGPEDGRAREARRLRLLPATPTSCPPPAPGPDDLAWERGGHEDRAVRAAVPGARLRRRAGHCQTARPNSGEPDARTLPDEARDVMAWITGTNTSDDAIEEMARAAPTSPRPTRGYPAEDPPRSPRRAPGRAGPPPRRQPEAPADPRTPPHRLRASRPRLRPARRPRPLPGSPQYGTAALTCAQEAEPTRGPPGASWRRPPAGR